MKIAIISVEKQFEINRISREARKRGHSIKFFYPTDLIPTLNERKKFDVALFRAIKGKETLCRLLAQSLYFNGTRIVDEKIALLSDHSKFFNYLKLKQAGIFIPQTMILTSKAVKEAKKIDSKYLIVKEIEGKRGQNVFKIKKNELKTFLKKLETKGVFLVQEFLEIEKEFRVLVVGRKALGCFSKKTSNWLHNVSRGAIPVKEKLSKKLALLAIKSCKAVNTEIGGVDIAVTNKGLTVLEVNRSPQFKGFEKSTGINVALEIVKYLEELK
jgi:ribosomal protein S6--L-glutamate ligase